MKYIFTIVLILLSLKAEACDNLFEYYGECSETTCEMLEDTVAYYRLKKNLVIMMYTDDYIKKYSNGKTYKYREYRLEGEKQIVQEIRCIMHGADCK